MQKQVSKTSGSALARLCDLMDLARSLAKEVPESTDPSYGELIETLATTQFCAQRLLAERNGERRKSTKQR